MDNHPVSCPKAQAVGQVPINPHQRRGNQAAPVWRVRETRLPGGDERSEIVQWTISAKNARPVGGPGGRRGLI